MRAEYSIGLTWVRCMVKAKTLLGLSEPKQAVDLYDECAILKLGIAGRYRIPLVVVDDEQLAARTVFPAQADIRRHGAGAGVVLQQCADEHGRRHGVRDP